MSIIFHTLFDVGMLGVTLGVPRELLAAIDNQTSIQELF